MFAIRSFIAQLGVTLVLAAAVAAQAPASPPATPRVLFVVTDGNHLYQVDFFDPAPTGPLNSAADADSRTALRDLVVRDVELGVRNRPDLIDLLVFDDLGGEADILRYRRDPTSGVWESSLVLRAQLIAPDGLSLGGGGALYFVDNPGASQVWVLPPAPGELPTGDGFGPNPVPIDLKSPCGLMVDTAVVRFQAPGLSFGDLLVLCQEPALVLRYPKGMPCSDPMACTPSERRPLLALPAGERPTSLVFTPGGDLLISTFDQDDKGKILRFFVDDGMLDVTPFVEGLPGGEARMVGGLQERDTTAGFGAFGPFLFYANRGDMSVARYAPAAGGGVLDPPGGAGEFNPVFFQDPAEGPVGVGIGTSRAAPTRPGDGTRLRPRQSLVATFDRVLQAGLTEARIFVFDDPRQPADDVPLHLCDPGLEYSGFDCEAVPEGPFVDLGLPNVIPSRVRPLTVVSGSKWTGFAKGELGPHPFVLFDLASTADFSDTVKLQGLEELVLGDDLYHCEDAAETGQIHEMPLFFHGADLDDPPVVEGFDFFAVPSGCGSNFGRTFAFSSFLVGRQAAAGELPPGPLNAALPAVQSLAGVLDPMVPGNVTGFIESQFLDQLVSLVEGARESVLAEKTQAAIETLEELLKAIQEKQDHIDDSQRNVSGELRVRATASIFLLCGGTNCSEAVDTHAEDVGEIFVDGFESGDPGAWSSSQP
jgi:hypothetical protein